MSDAEEAVTPEWVTSQIEAQGGIARSLAEEVLERAIAKGPSTSPQSRVREVITEMKEDPHWQFFFIPEKTLTRSELSNEQKSQYIREHGVDNYLGLPWDE